MIIIPAVATERASTEFIFTHLNTENGMGIHDKAYILAMGLLMSQYSLIGYDASAHMVCYQLRIYTLVQSDTKYVLVVMVIIYTT